MDSTKYISSDEVALILGFSKHWVQTRRKILNIPSYRIGGEYRFIEEEVHQWVRDQNCAANRPLDLNNGSNQKVNLV